MLQNIVPGPTGLTEKYIRVDLKGKRKWGKVAFSIAKVLKDFRDSLRTFKCSLRSVFKYSLRSLFFKDTENYGNPLYFLQVEIVTSYAFSVNVGSFYIATLGSLVNNIDLRAIVDEK